MAVRTGFPTAAIIAKKADLRRSIIAETITHTEPTKLPASLPSRIERYLSPSFSQARARRRTMMFNEAATQQIGFAILKSL